MIGFRAETEMRLRRPEYCQGTSVSAEASRGLTHSGVAFAHSTASRQPEKSAKLEPRVSPQIAVGGKTLQGYRKTAAD